jgi:hypothetical protein
MTAMTASLPRSCPRCHGYLFHARDRFGSYSSCVACGFVQEWVAGPAIELPDEGNGRRRRREPSSNGRRI